jgi:N-acetylglutamate synthase-like GNAT family acetyltransferase
MRVAAKKIRRTRAAGELAIAQTGDRELIAQLLDQAGIVRAIDAPGACFVAAYAGDEAVGVAGVECKVDAAMITALWVREPMRGRGIGGALLAAARLAAHTRGARRLYAIADESAGRWLVRRGFAAEPAAAIGVTMAGAANAAALIEKIAAAGWSGFALDISGDGIIER